MPSEDPRVKENIPPLQCTVKPWKLRSNSLNPTKSDRSSSHPDRDDNDPTNEADDEQQPTHLSQLDVNDDSNLIKINHRNDNDFFLEHKLIGSGSNYCSSYLRSGSRFIGTQQSGQSTYDVEVILKTVDIENAFLCGYLKIEGLTEDHPKLTTYFEGEMVSEQCSFFTKHRDWGADRATDLNHWSRFAPWRLISDKVKQPGYCHENFKEKDHIYMRWKECFLVPDHRVSLSPGTSYAGFYYICFDQVNGCVSGYYFHKNWDKYQQLELSFASDCQDHDTFEFR